MPPDSSGGRSGARHAEEIAASVDAIRRIVRELRIASQQMQGDLGVSAAQLFVLRQLRHAPAQSLSELGARTLTDRSSVADVVEKLAQRGLVRRAQSDEDRRRTTIVITLAGRALLQRAPKPPTARLIDALRALEPTTLATLAAGLTRLTEAMGIEGEPATMLFEDDEPTAH